MPGPAHGLDGLVCDGLGAALALGEGLLDVALLAEGVAVVLVVAHVLRELGLAAPAREVVVVPGLVHRLHAGLQCKKRGKSVEYST